MQSASRAAAYAGRPVQEPAGRIPCVSISACLRPRVPGAPCGGAMQTLLMCHVRTLGAACGALPAHHEHSRPHAYNAPSPSAQRSRRRGMPRHMQTVHAADPNAWLDAWADQRQTGGSSPEHDSSSENSRKSSGIGSPLRPTRPVMPQTLQEPPNPPPPSRTQSGITATPSANPLQQPLTPSTPPYVPRARRPPPSGSAGGRRGMSTDGGRGAAAGGPSAPFAAFRAFQQAAPLAAMGSDEDMDVGGAGGRLAAFRRAVRPQLQRHWYASPRMTAAQLHAEVVQRCEHTALDAGPLFMLLRAARSAEDAQLALGAVSCVRAARARLLRDTTPLGGQKFAAAFTRMCVACEAPDTLAAAVARASELGLAVTHRSVHEALIHWGALQEIGAMERVMGAMAAGGLPPTPKTAYIAVRAAVNAGRQDAAEAVAAHFKAQGVRLNPTTERLLQLGRRRAQERADAMAGTDL